MPDERIVEPNFGQPFSGTGEWQSPVPSRGWAGDDDAGSDPSAQGYSGSGGQELPESGVETPAQTTRPRALESESPDRQFGKPFAFALAHGVGGASIWWGLLLVVKLPEGSRITGSDPTIKEHFPENLDPDRRLQTHLGWWGDVYLSWNVSESGNIDSVKVEGPETPDADEWVLIGTVNEGGPVDQLVSSDITFVTGGQTREGGTSSTGLLGSSDPNARPDSTPSDSSDDSNMPEDGECYIKGYVGLSPKPDCADYFFNPVTNRYSPKDFGIVIKTQVGSDSAKDKACECVGANGQWWVSVRIDGATFPSWSVGRDFPPGAVVVGGEVHFPIPCGLSQHGVYATFDPAVPESQHGWELKFRCAAAGGDQASNPCCGRTFIQTESYGSKSYPVILPKRCWTTAPPPPPPTA